MSETVIPEGVKIAPKAEHALEQALASLRRGLPVSAWRWAERARAELGRLTENEAEPEPTKNQKTEVQSGYLRND